jgi:hypothetical protein
VAATKGGVVAPHHTDVNEREWDGDAAERALDGDDVGAFREAFAYVDPDNPERKTGAKFPHHEVSRGGKVGAANVKALISGVGILNGGRGGADISQREREAIYDHLATHFEGCGARATGAGRTLDGLDERP